MSSQNLTNDPTLQNWIGRGLIFPITLTQGKPPISSGFDMIRHSLDNVLAWSVGDRMMLGEFGSMLYTLLQRPNDQVLWALAREYIIDSVQRWEKRVTLLEANFTIISETELSIELRYKLTNSELENSYIYPFYSHITT
mgnify:CR=1 FL=1